MVAPDRIETPRLILRAPCLDDADAIFAEYAQDPIVSKYLVWKPHRQVPETRAFLQRCKEERLAGRSFAFVVLKKNNDHPIGMVEIGSDGCLGYVLGQAYWGQGLMTEAVKAVVAWASAQDSISKIWATCDVGNPASARVMEKAGLKFEKALPKHSHHPNVSSELRDALKYSIIKK